MPIFVYRAITKKGTIVRNKVEEILSRALYDTGVTSQYGQQLITLSTCYGSTKNDRLIVIGVEISAEGKK